MAVQLSVAARNARLDSIETTIGVSALCRIYTGSMPADCATAASGTKLVEIACPSDYLSNAAAGVKAKSGVWSVAAVAAGTAGYFRLTDSTGTTAHIQGTVTATGGGGDMTLDNAVIANGQTVTVNTFSLTDANA